MRIFKKIIGLILIVILLIPSLCILGLACWLLDILNIAVEWCDSDVVWNSSIELKELDDIDDVYSDFE